LVDVISEPPNDLGGCGRDLTKGHATVPSDELPKETLAISCRGNRIPQHKRITPPAVVSDVAAIVAEILQPRLSCRVIGEREVSVLANQFQPLRQRRSHFGSVRLFAR